MCVGQGSDGRQQKTTEVQSASCGGFASQASARCCNQCRANKLLLGDAMAGTVLPISLRIPSLRTHDVLSGVDCNSWPSSAICTTCAASFDRPRACWAPTDQPSAGSSACMQRHPIAC